MIGRKGARSIKASCFLIPLVAVVLMASVSFVMRAGLEWYGALNLPVLTPPVYVFSIVCGIIFILGSISALIVWNQKRHRQEFDAILVLFSINVILNFLWSYYFFGLQAVGAAFSDAVLLELSVIALIAVIWKSSKTASLLLVPYAAWGLYAIFLNYHVWLLNQ